MIFTRLYIMLCICEGLLTVGVEAQANGLSCILSDQMIRETKMTENMEF